MLAARVMIRVGSAAQVQVRTLETRTRASLLVARTVSKGIWVLVERS